MPSSPSPSTAPAPAPASAGRGARRVAGIAACVLVVLVGLRLAGLYDATRRAAGTEAQLAGEVDALATEVAGLRTQEAVVATDAFVERWAREERGWVRAGDHPFAVAVVTAAPTVTPAATPAAPGALARLRRWLRGEPGAGPGPTP